jgi:hypothetical protein
MFLSPALFTRCLLLLLAAMVLSPAHATTVLCIESSAALYQAVGDIDGGSTDDITLKLRSGTYTLGSDLLLDYRGNGGDPQAGYGKLTLSGGWNAGCTSQSATLGATTLNGNGQRTFEIETINNALLIDHLSSNNVDWALSNWICYQAKDRPATLNFLRALNTRVSFDFMGCYDIAVQNSLFTARSDSANDRVVTYSSYFGTGANPASFTLTTSTLRGGGLYLGFLPFDDSQNPDAALVQLFGNVFENDGSEVVVDGANVYAGSNRYDSLSVSRGVLATNSNNISTAPLLQSSGVPQNASPLVNAGTRFVPGGLPALDLAGNPRKVGSDPDIGAFETAVDNSFYLDVINTAASGAGSLAQAVASANATDGRQVIRFNIPGTCPRTITLGQTLTLTDATDIAGETQPGAQANTFAIGYNGAPCIVLKAGSGVSGGIVFDSTQAADDLSLSQIAFAGFTTALSIRSGRSHLVTGNQFGGMLGNITLLDSGTAIRVDDSAGDVQIGGPDAEQANFIGGAGLGIVLDGTGDNRVLGNAIGEGGLTQFPNTVGIAVTSDHNRIDDNWISLSSAVNVLMSGDAAHDNILSDNLISGGGTGLNIDEGAHHNRIGPDNYFGANDGDAIHVHSGSHNDLGGNRYGSNGGLGIDLGDNGVTPNDADPIFDSNVSPNRNQNYPVLDRAVKSVQFALISVGGYLSSTTGSYRLEFYRSHTCDDSGYGEGSSLIATQTLDLDCSIVGNDQQCRKTFSVLINGNFVAGDRITVTATSPADNTSEFSACETILEADDRIFADDFE